MLQNVGDLSSVSKLFPHGPIYYLQGASSATEPSRHQTFPDNCEITDFFKELNIQFNISEESPQNLSSMNRFFFNLQPSKKNHYSFAVFFFHFIFKYSLFPKQNLEFKISFPLPTQCCLHFKNRLLQLDPFAFYLQP